MDANGIPLVEGRDVLSVLKCTGQHVPLPPLPLTKNYPAPNVNSAEGEKLAKREVEYAERA